MSGIQPACTRSSRTLGLSNPTGGACPVFPLQSIPPPPPPPHPLSGCLSLASLLLRPSRAVPRPKPGRTPAPNPSPRASRALGARCSAPLPPDPPPLPSQPRLARPPIWAATVPSLPPPAMAGAAYRCRLSRPRAR